MAVSASFGFGRNEKKPFGRALVIIFANTTRPIELLDVYYLHIASKTKKFIIVSKSHANKELSFIQKDYYHHYYCFLLQQKFTNQCIRTKVCMYLYNNRNLTILQKNI